VRGAGLGAELLDALNEVPEVGRFVIAACKGDVEADA
jgi:hypothetical protein